MALAPLKGALAWLICRGLNPRPIELASGGSSVICSCCHFLERAPWVCFSRPFSILAEKRIMKWYSRVINHYYLLNGKALEEWQENSIQMLSIPRAFEMPDVGSKTWSLFCGVGDGKGLCPGDLVQLRRMYALESLLRSSNGLGLLDSASCLCWTCCSRFFWLKVRPRAHRLSIMLCFMKVIN